MLTPVEKNRVKVKKWREANPEKYREYNRKYLKRCRLNNDEFREKANKRSNKWREENSEYTKSYKNDIYRERRKIFDGYKRNLFCKRCGFSGKTQPEKLCFHHRRKETRNFNVGQGMLRSWKMLLEEIRKCDVYCLNCHRIIHKQQKKTKS